MNNEEILKLALDKSPTIAEAKEAAEWMKRFLAEDTAKKESDREQIKLREQQILNTLGKPIDDPDFHVDPNLRPKNWDVRWVALPFDENLDAPIKRKKRTPSGAKNGNHPITQEDLAFLKREIVKVKTRGDFQRLADSMGRSKKSVYEMITRKMVDIEPHLLPEVIFPRLSKGIKKNS
jgi:hypothetical protein